MAGSGLGRGLARRMEEGQCSESAGVVKYGSSFKPRSPTRCRVRRIYMLCFFGLTVGSFGSLRLGLRVLLLGFSICLSMCKIYTLGRALGHFIFSLIGRKRILFTNIFKSFKAPPSTNVDSTPKAPVPVYGVGLCFFRVRVEGFGSFGLGLRVLFFSVL